MALLPPIPDRPADRPETWTEYLSRRAIVAMHRQFADELGSWLKRQPAFDPFRYFIDMAGNRVPFRATRGQTLPIAYGTKRVPSNVVFIDEDVTWRNDAVRRLLADPSVTDLFVTDAGILQVTNLDVDLAPELKEVIAGRDEMVAKLESLTNPVDAVDWVRFDMVDGPRKRRAGTNPTS